MDSDQIILWRDDRSETCRNEYPSVSRIVKCATDNTEYQATGEYGTYRLDIDHVLYFHGKGFMPSLFRMPVVDGPYPRRGEWAGNGDVAKTHVEALEAGKTWLAERVMKDNADWAKFEAEQADIRRRRDAGEFPLATE
jgi:hypothetical protein